MGSGCPAYHVSPQIGFFILLEAFEVLKYAGAGIFDVFLGYLEGLFQL
jgi:hypothetical protein